MQCDLSRVTACAVMLFLLPVSSHAHDSDDPSTFVSRAVVCGVRGDFERAKKYLDSASPGSRGRTAADARELLKELDENRVEPHAAMFYFKGLQLLAEKRPAEAVREFTTAISISPDFSRGYRALGSLCSAEGKYREASEWLVKAFAADRGDGRSAHALADTYKLQGDFEAAIAFYRIAEDSGCAGPGTYLSIGESYNAIGQPLKAQEAFARVLSLDSRSAEAHIGLGRVAAAAGDDNQAARHYETAQRLFRAAGAWERAEQAREQTGHDG